MNNWKKWKVCHRQKKIKRSVIVTQLGDDEIGKIYSSNITVVEDFNTGATFTGIKTSLKTKHITLAHY